jgi:hypothetical protein
LLGQERSEKKRLLEVPQEAKREAFHLKGRLNPLSVVLLATERPRIFLNFFGGEFGSLGVL